jgi:hypothetical protein
MSPTHKSSHTREDEEVERTAADAPSVDDVEPEERTVGSKLDEEGEDNERDVGEDDITEEIDLDALPAMEGPDA